MATSTTTITVTHLRTAFNLTEKILGLNEQQEKKKMSRKQTGLAVSFKTLEIAKEKP